MTNHNGRVLYTGVTSNLKKRVYQHKMKLTRGFTQKYFVNKLVYYEVCQSIITAISREKQSKNLSRIKKIVLIDGFNTGWQDLYDTI